NELRADLWAATDPVNPRRRDPRSVGLDRDLESDRVQGDHQFFVQLQERLAAGANDKRGRPVAGGVLFPLGGDSSCESVCGRKLSTPRAVGSDEIRVAKAADRR